jgi:hypothetical protein
MGKMRRTGVIALAPMLLALVAADGARAQNRPPQTLDQARAELASRGFQPARLRHHPGSEPVGLCVRTDICARHPEVFFCSGGSPGICDFAFFRPADRKWMVVETTGGTAFSVQSIRAASVSDLELIREYL